MELMLEFIVFVSGAVVMMLEVTGARILAPYVGTSTATWTSIIGVILASLSIGYAVGGRMADTQPSKRTLAFILLLASFSLAMVIIIKNPFLSFLRALFNNDIRSISLISTIVLFGIPSVLLGIVSPYCARLKIQSLKTSGRTLGNLYAISTAGSIGGTFLTGFVLIGYMGNTEILMTLSMLLLVCAWITSSKTERAAVVAVSFIAVGSVFAESRLPVSTNRQVIATTDTAYNSVWIFETTDQKTNRPVRAMVTDPFSAQSAVFRDGDGLVFTYTQVYDKLTELFPNVQNALLIGGGAFTFPSYFVNKYNAPIDAVEIDPKLTGVSQQFFNLTENNLLAIINEDGRSYLNRNTKKYDIIYMDAYNSYIPPYHLTTRETVTELKRSVSADGVVIVNMISPIVGRNEFLQAVYKTYKTAFPEIAVLQIAMDRNPRDIQNVLLIAAQNRSLKERLVRGLNRQSIREVNLAVSDDIQALTDDFAPIEHYIQKLY